MPRLSKSQQKENEKHFLMCIKYSKQYIWIDKANVYAIKNNKMNPKDMKGYIELVYIVSKDFAKLFIEYPDVLKCDGKYLMSADKDKERLIDFIHSM
tara:strand:- start:1 stop:291 length:291 start_codon:yes stop_codon:yes gene_type:complete